MGTTVWPVTTPNLPARRTSSAHAVATGPGPARPSRRGRGTCGTRVRPREGSQGREAGGMSVRHGRRRRRGTRTASPSRRWAEDGTHHLLPLHRVLPGLYFVSPPTRRVSNFPVPCTIGIYTECAGKRKQTEKKNRVNECACLSLFTKFALLTRFATMPAIGLPASPFGSLASCRLCLTSPAEHVTHLITVIFYHFVSHQFRLSTELVSS